MLDIDKYTGRLGNRLFQYAYLYSQAKKGVIPDIYVQHYEYFEEYAEEIRKLFGQNIGLMPYVAIHLRRGDYVNNDFYVDLAQTGYYINATNEFKGRRFLVFSDDIEFAKTYFEGDKFAFDDTKDPIETINRMASCDSHIIANSSFSWWGAFLSPHYGKVIYPKLWFKDGINRVTFPQHWICIE